MSRRTEQFVDLLTKRAMPVVADGSTLDQSGLEEVGGTMRQQLTSGRPGHAFAVSDQDVWLYALDGLALVGVMAETIQREKTIELVRAWAEAATPAFSDASAQTDLALNLETAHPAGGKIQVLLSFLKDGDSAAHATCAWLGEA